MAELKGSKYYTVVTDIGQAKIANSIYSGKKLDLTLLKLGDGNGAFYNPDSSQTDVKKEVWRGNVVDVEIDAGNPNWINIYTVIAPTDGGFTIREMAVFDSDGDMIGICNCAESYKPTLDEGSGKEITMKMTLAVVNTSAITLKIDPTIIYAKRKDVLELQTKVNEITKQINNLENDSYPIVEATGTNAYIGASARIKAVGKGTRCTLFVGTASNGNCSLNLNNSGAVAIKDSNGNVVTNMKANIPYNLCHNGSDFILQGKGGGGNLIPKYLLAGYYGEGDNGRVDGAMVNRGAPTSNLNCGGVVNLQEGYYAGGQIIANSLASQTPANADASKILAGYSAWVNGVNVNGNATIQSLGGIPVYSKILNRSITSSYELIEIPLVENSGKHFVFVTFEGAATRTLTCIIDFQSSFNGAVSLYDNTGEIDSYMNIQHNSFTSYKWCLVPNKHREGIVNLYVI